jgi:uncharacterized protein YdiU (UPF0061 family)
MVAHWMRVGFVHGVMNTDNMSILGLTIDYGPYGWLEGYEPDWTPNTTDAQHHRYQFIQQPQIALWNLQQLARAIYPLVQDAEKLSQCLHHFSTEYVSQWQLDMANKLGLEQFNDGDNQLVDQLHNVLQLTETDMTIFYRLLANFSAENIDVSDEQLVQVIAPAYYVLPSLDAVAGMAGWLRRYADRLEQDKVLFGSEWEQRKRKMDSVNPKYVLRNYLAQQAIDKANEGDYSEIENLLTLLRRPYDEQPEHEKYFSRRPEWARTKAGCSMLSCSS